VRLTELAHALLAETVRPGSRAVDATAGNGHDTLFLARQVHPGGKVLALDIQPAAVAATRERLEQAGLGATCEVRVADHAGLADLLPDDFQGATDGIILNLGYLPGSDHAVTTLPGGTVAALRVSLANLRPGGRLVCVAYTGHPGGEAEGAAVAAFAEDCQEQGHRVDIHQREPGSGKPWLLAVTRAP
jgi:SAM-dependent methyltransferase